MRSNKYERKIIETSKSTKNGVIANSACSSIKTHYNKAVQNLQSVVDNIPIRKFSNEFKYNSQHIETYSNSSSSTKSEGKKIIVHLPEPKSHIITLNNSKKIEKKEKNIKKNEETIYMNEDNNIRHEILEMERLLSELDSKNTNKQKLLFTSLIKKILHKFHHKKKHLKSKISILLSENQTLRISESNLHKLLLEKEKKIEELELKLQDIIQERDDLSEKLVISLKNESILQGELTALKPQIEYRDREIKNLREQLEKIKVDNDQLYEENKKLFSKSVRFESEYNMIKEENERLKKLFESRIEEYKSEIIKINRKNDDLFKENINLKTENHDFTIKIKKLEEEIQEFIQMKRNNEEFIRQRDLEINNLNREIEYLSKRPPEIIEKIIEKEVNIPEIIEKPIDRIIEKPIDRIIEKIIEKPIEVFIKDQSLINEVMDLRNLYNESELFIRKLKNNENLIIEENNNLKMKIDGLVEEINEIYRQNRIKNQEISNTIQSLIDRNINLEELLIQQGPN